MHADAFDLVDIKVLSFIYKTTLLTTSTNVLIYDIFFMVDLQVKMSKA